MTISLYIPMCDGYIVKIHTNINVITLKVEELSYYAIFKYVSNYCEKDTFKRYFVKISNSTELSCSLEKASEC